MEKPMENEKHKSIENDKETMDKEKANEKEKSN